MKRMATVGSGIWRVPLFSRVYHLLLAFSKKLWPFPHSRPTTWCWPLVRRWLKTLLWSLFSKVTPWNTSGIIHIAATANSPHTRKKETQLTEWALNEKQDQGSGLHASGQKALELAERINSSSLVKESFRSALGRIHGRDSDASADAVSPVTNGNVNIYTRPRIYWCAASCKY